MKNIANYHTHTYLCNHGEGTPADYVSQAVKEGCEELGFSDHVPYPQLKEEEWQNIRMRYDQIEDYIAMINDSKQYANFKVYTGFECEWDKDYASYLKDELIEKYKVDYLILGSHWVKQGTKHIYIANPLDNNTVSDYIDQTIEGIQSGLFKFIAHPDLFMAGCKEWNDNTIAWSKSIIQAAIDADLPLEINGLGINKKRIETSKGIRYQYPYQEFWELVAQTDAKVICNADAHNPKDVIFNNQMARDFASRFGIKIIDKLEF